CPCLRHEDELSEPQAQDGFETARLRWQPALEQFAQDQVDVPTPAQRQGDEPAGEGAIAAIRNLLGGEWLETITAEHLAQALGGGKANRKAGRRLVPRQGLRLAP